MQMTAAMEDYLEAIYVLQKRNGEVRMTDISAFLSVTKPSANRAVGALKERGYLTHESYGTITLTPKGEQAAADVLHRHKTIKSFLTKTLGVGERTAEEDACKMEHVMSEETMEKLLGFFQRMHGKEPR